MLKLDCDEIPGREFIDKASFLDKVQFGTAGVVGLKASKPVAVFTADFVMMTFIFTWNDKKRVFGSAQPILSIS